MAKLAGRTYSRVCILLVAWGGVGAAIAQSGGAGQPGQPGQVETRSGAAGIAKTNGQPGYVIKARVPLTIVDVVVTDGKGKPVHGLKQADFTVLEDGKEVTPNSFEEHRADAQPTPAGQAAPMFATQDVSPNTFTNSTPAVGDRPINILLLDFLNTSAQEQGMVEQQMLRFVGKIQPGTRVAVLGLSTHLFILQGLTTDAELLKAAILSKKILPMPSSTEDPFQDLMNIGPGDTGEKPWMTVDLEGEQSALRGQYELSGMRQIARYLSGMPGRKNLIWFTGSFPLQFPSFPDNEAFPPAPGELMRPQSYDFEPELKAATDMLARAHVVVYPIDGRGLEALPPPIGFKGKNRNYMQILEHGTMDDIAEQTGGKAFYNTNGFVEAVEQALDNGSNYYTLTYTPVNQVLDTRFRAISVKVDQPGVKLVYRDGYYAVDPGTTLSGKKVEKVTAMQSAMMRGALEPTQILFKVKVVQMAGTEETLPVSNKPDAKLMKPPYRHYTISYVIDVSGIEFSPSMDGNYRGDFEYGAMVYNADGDEVMNSASKTVSPILPPVVYQSMRRGGANAHLDIDLPATGEYFLRIGVHDLTSDRVGAIEVPVSSIKPETAVAAEETGRR